VRLLPALLAAAVLSAQAPPRAIVVIGDLHMGPGRDAEGRWHPYEDFRWRDEFIRFLDALNADGGDIDLVINGDLFELLQSPDVPCRRGDARLGCSESEALKRLDSVIAAHADEIAAIGKFASARGHRVHVVPGDHDAALLMPRVWERAEAAFAAPARVILVAAGRWVSPDGRVHVEHGHQLPLSADRFANWPNPFLVGSETHLERPWGEQVLLPFYDRTETRYPLVDNVAEEGSGAKIVAASLDEMPAEGAAPLLKLLLTKTTWQQFRMDLDDGEVQAPEWDLQRIRAEPAAFLAASLPSDDPFASIVKRAAADDLAAAARTLSDEQIVAVCDYRAAIRRARRRMERVLTQLSGVGAPMPECPRAPGTVGPAFEYYWRSRDRQVAGHVAEAKTRDAIVFGHTHLLDRLFRPLGGDGPVVVTSGAWQRTILPLQAKALDALPESLPPCYTFVRIPAAGGTRVPEPRAWRQDERGNWSASAGGC
jgi:UDP-2,3-diacylglucosamine pyrophosphatase LpxH